ncbi:hypothetical protein WJX84_007540 [Apatococcus fuscideae]|uniref:Signal peptidase complex catalytic subunit SEC11 n=1 Tax=Apatococcus fuscideae TaxID=2026836 RepID=A0AAW1T054_9CHLO
MEAVRRLLKDQYQELVSLNFRGLLLQGTNLGLVVTSALIIWRALILITGSESPVVVVLSGSMEPGFFRGDILFLYQSNAPVRTGEIVVFKLDHRKREPGHDDIPIVHRAVTVHEREPGGMINILTKGDANRENDLVGGIYDGIQWLNKQHVMGRVVGYLPYVGQVTLIMNDYPKVKYALIGLLGLFIFTSKE